MNGAQTLVKTLEKLGVTVCFANPGTTELEIVEALGLSEKIKTVPVLYEGVAIGAADGYGRMTGIPGSALLHTGAGFPNGLSSVLNAAKSNSPLIAIVGDHPLEIREWNHVIASGVDITDVARPYAKWVKRTSSDTVSADAEAAFHAATACPPGPATLVVPSDVAWSESAPPTEATLQHTTPKVPQQNLDNALMALKSGQPVALIVHDQVTTNSQALEAAHRIRQATGCSVMARAARVIRGPDIPPIDFLPYTPPLAVHELKKYKYVILAGAHPPIFPWTYPENDLPMMTSPDCHIIKLARMEQDVVDALTRLAEHFPECAKFEAAKAAELEPSGGEITPDNLAVSIGALIPENAVVIDEAVTTGRSFYERSVNSERHDWLRNLGGALGYGQPVAIGCAFACPDRKVIVLQGDGAAMYNPQALWTIAREKLNVLVVIFANRTYQVLKVDMKLRNQDLNNTAGKTLTEIGGPDIDWVNLAESLGIPGHRVTTMEEFNEKFAEESLSSKASLIEVVL